MIQAASGAGKSSFLKAGLWPRLKRDPDFAPLCMLRPAQGILSGPDGIGQRIAVWFDRQRRMKVPGDIEASLMQANRAAAVSALAGLLAEATALATTARRAGVIDARPSAPLLAVDQGEELFASENAAESERFLELLAAVFNELPEDVDPYVLVTIRADSVERLLQRWPALGLAAPETQILPPLSLTAYRDVITKPAEAYTERVRRLLVEPALADKLTLDATGGDALPLLAFTLEKLFEKFGADGNLTLQRYEGMKGIGGSIDTALGEATRQAGVIGTPDNLRRLILPGLATWDPAANAAKRLIAAEAELLGGRWSELTPLADALVANRLLTRGAGTLEVAHEALLRRPPIDGWLAEQKDALKHRDDVLREAKEWADGGQHAESLVRRGERLKAALALATSEDFKSALRPAAEYLKACGKLERSARSRARRVQALVYVLFVGMIVGLLGWINQGFIKEQWKQWSWYWRGRPFAAANILPYVLAAEAERALKAGDPFRECAPVQDKQDKDYCPEMVVVPAGSFMMGSPPTEKGRSGDEDPPHWVTIATAFAVAKFELTFDEWNTCVDYGDCAEVANSDLGEGRQPVINVTWDDAQRYVGWLSRVTGKPYRLLTEAEYEYAARAGTQTAYPWGDDIKLDGKAMANCDLCGSRWDKKGTAPVGSFYANKFGLYDMVGNVFSWVEDCYHPNYDDAPRDGSDWRTGCPRNNLRLVRGGGWRSNPSYVRSANRAWVPASLDFLGFRLGRTLTP